MYGNKLFYCEGIDDPEKDRDDIRPVADGGKFNLIGSIVMEEKVKGLFGRSKLVKTHKPALDLDFPCTLVPSTKEGHCHFYIDKELTHQQYERLLSVMVEVGLIQQGILNRFHKSGQTCLRPPGHKKPEGYDERIA